MSVPIHWDDGPTPSNPESVDQRSTTAHTDDGTPFHPKADCVVWFLGDVSRTMYHYAGRSVGCRGEGHCAFCDNGDIPQPVGYAPILLNIGSEKGEPVWQQRILRVSKRNFDDVGSPARGKLFNLRVTKGRAGARVEYSFQFRSIQEPPVEAFDFKQVMMELWFPSTRPSKPKNTRRVKAAIVLPTATTTAPARPKTFDEEVAEMSDEKLADMFVRFRGSPMKHMESVLEAEMLRRHLNTEPASPANVNRETHEIQVIAMPKRKAGAA